MKSELLSAASRWFRIAQAHWSDPLDPSFSRRGGGRWNPPGGHAALYFNGDLVTARFNFRRFARHHGYEPEDLDQATGPILVEATLPRRQEVADAHTPDGVKELRLPPTYPLDSKGRIVPWAHCQQIGVRIRAAGLRGVHCRSAEVPERAGRELAWFPATSRSRAKRVRTWHFPRWYW